jgi:hypothetical protein
VEQRSGQRRPVPDRVRLHDVLGVVVHAAGGVVEIDQALRALTSWTTPGRVVQS